MDLTSETDDKLVGAKPEDILDEADPDLPDRGTEVEIERDAVSDEDNRDVTRDDDAAFELYGELIYGELIV